MRNIRSKTSIGSVGSNVLISDTYGQAETQQNDQLIHCTPKLDEFATKSP